MISKAVSVLCKLLQKAVSSKFCSLYRLKLFITSGCLHRLWFVLGFFPTSSIRNEF